MKKLNKYKLFFLISFIPFLLLLIFACYNAIFGYYDAPLLPSGGGGITYYGFEAIKYTIFWYGLGLTIIPVFPVCVVYQLIYLIVSANKKIRAAPDYNNPEKVKKRRDVSKTFFFVSFVPVLLWIVSIIVSSIRGIGRWTLTNGEIIEHPRIYGSEAIRIASISFFGAYWFIIIPAIIYQIFYIVQIIRKK
jgi:hypothetical protein